MASSLWHLALISSLLFQAGLLSAVPGPDGLLDSERARVEREPKLDRRIKIYEAASLRYQGSVSSNVQNQEFQSVPAQLKSWTNLLATSLADVEKSASRKEKSKALIHYEIHLRKAISDMQELKLKGTVDEFDSFEAWLSKAEETHKKFVDMLFQR